MRNEEGDGVEDAMWTEFEAVQAAEAAAEIEAEERAIQEELAFEREELEGDVGSELESAIEWDDWETEEPDTGEESLGYGMHVVRLW